MFNKILIANRGEIACRIIRTARRFGIQTVAVYSTADEKAQHVMLADEAYLIGEAPSQESYLKAETILSIAKKTQAQAIHPGYGFLSENTDFAKACQKAGIAFIGPSVKAIEAMASKSAAKKIMEKAKVPVIPGYHGDNQDEKHLQKEAKKIGYPVLLKAAAGGGGKGMRLVHKEKDFIAGLQAAKREARSSFGDDIIIIEKYLEKTRHIEIQVFADNKGNTVHLFERDCSIQRRHQKIIEETPAVGMTETLRTQMGNAAVKAAKAIQYTGAGTIEFLLSDNNEFYFMEMNTRLQVEHPITEMITGIDLVEWQLRIAADEPLPLQQKEITRTGHAIETRIYAEDPQKDFMPAMGEIVFLRTPENSNHIRIDSGIVEGDAISMHYDPMIAKLIVWGEDRGIALRHLQTALKDYQLAGFKTNIPYLQTIIKHPEFINGKLSTNFIDQHHEKLLKIEEKINAKALAIASLYLLLTQETKEHAPWEIHDAWQMNLPPQQDIIFMQQETKIIVSVKHLENSYSLQWDNEKEALISGQLIDTNKINIIIDGESCSCTIFQSEDQLTLFGLESTQTITRFNPLKHYARSEQSSGHLNAPMPGTIVAVLKNDGDKVECGESLIVIEAMKMEHTINAPSTGIVKKVHYFTGDQVDEGAELVSFEAV